jgi:ergothioneine biosynthesis protein EgtB
MSTPDSHDLRGHLARRFQAVRARTEQLALPLSAEDQGLQSGPACSPTKWHRAHTTWFFETFLLAPRGVPPVDARWGVLFNSYYVAVGPRHARPKRGMLSRPSVAEIGRYREIVDARMAQLLATLDDEGFRALAPLVELGIAHEEQHQELILTDVLSAFSESPLRPAYAPPVDTTPASPRPLGFVDYEGGLVEIGLAPSPAFSFDNESPRHRRWLEPFSLGDRLLTVGEWKAFADAGGYETASLWLSEGFQWVVEHEVRAPLYGRREGGALVVFGLGGEREAADDEPISHLGYYEADALARFVGGRLPTEAEWEHAAASAPAEGHFLGPSLRPLPARAAASAPAQLFGDAWEWTASSYDPYPGYRAAEGALGEYNGKFMVNQLVLRGGSCLTPPGHVRATYRNFWPPDTRFQMTGVRVARSSIG